MNSNTRPGANVPSERQALLNRMMLVRNLRQYHVLPIALQNTNRSKPHPKFLTLIEPPSDLELNVLEKGDMPAAQLLLTKGLHPRTFLFQDSWQHFLDDPVNRIGATPPPPPTELSPPPDVEPPEPLYVPSSSEIQAINAVMALDTPTFNTFAENFGDQRERAPAYSEYTPGDIFYSYNTQQPIPTVSSVRSADLKTPLQFFTPPPFTEYQLSTPTYQEISRTTWYPVPRCSRHTLSDPKENSATLRPH
ncbi:hypothetical protein RRG08_000799 [Elysia crispata]|uniref:Uncharacterized protein n=1 Tax=Elysia crispata TaxID=231223 RepID=A0AAE0XMI4_9GAST|nr:hypothetical protein RRG08_000799 [Elysia crispata]